MSNTFGFGGHNVLRSIQEIIMGLKIHYKNFYLKDLSKKKTEKKKLLSARVSKIIGQNVKILITIMKLFH